MGQSKIIEQLLSKKSAASSLYLIRSFHNAPELPLNLLHAGLGAVVLTQPALL